MTKLDQEKGDNSFILGEIDRDKFANNVITSTNFSRRLSGAEMDEQRRDTAFYAYLCRLYEVKEWSNKEYFGITCIKEFFRFLKSGVILAEIAKANGFKCKIYRESAMKYFEVENISVFLEFLKTTSLPKHFYFETIDLRDEKDIPKVISCLHALAELLKEQGKTKGIVEMPKSEFTREEIKFITGLKDKELERVIESGSNEKTVSGKIKEESKEKFTKASPLGEESSKKLQEKQKFIKKEEGITFDVSSVPILEKPLNSKLSSNHSTNSSNSQVKGEQKLKDLKLIYDSLPGSITDTTFESYNNNNNCFLS